MAALDLEQLLDAPNLPQLLQQAELALRQEARRREEFYTWLKEDIKAEFINGQIVMHSPVKERHWTTVGNLMGLLRPYALKHKLGRVASEKALIALARNDYEPDVCFWKQEKAVQFTADQMKLPAPDLVIEVLSKGTARRDRGVKFTDYAANSIAEYWIVNPGKKTVEQYELEPDLEEYVHIGTFTKTEEIESKIVSGFRIPVQAVFDETVSNEFLISLLSR